MESTSYSYDSILTLSEQLHALIEETEVNKIEDTLKEYSNAIQQYYVNANRNNLTQLEFEKFKNIMFEHEKIKEIVEQKKQDIFKKIKQLNTGKEMVNTYPDLA